MVACVSEERLTRVKSWSGFPARAIREVLRLGGVDAGDVDRLVLHGFSPWVYGLMGQYGEGGSQWHLPVRAAMSRLLNSHPGAYPTYRLVRDRMFRALVHEKWQRERLCYASAESGVPLERIVCADHHRCHAYAGVHATLGRPAGRYLVLTNDGRGDDYCAAVWVYDSGSWTRLATTANDHSVAYIYLAVTELLGMKGNEHEYKVMGLAPYAAPADVARSVKMLKPLVWCSGLNFGSKVPAQAYYHYLREHLERHRFDWIAGAAQEVTEDLLTQWVRNAIEQTGIRAVILSGGTYLNVKANMRIAAMPEVETLTICPSPSDDSSAIGAAYWGYEQECQRQGIPFEPQPLADLYLGGEYHDVEIADGMARALRGGLCGVAQRVGDIEARVARLLADGEVVARFDGRMEFGARALGNRSLLANPADPAVIEILNRQIKSRDFWMPFAGTLLHERAHEYVKNPKQIPAPHMVMAFETTARARRDMPAAMHPFDHTMRPQVLDEATNSKFHRLLKHFEALTDIGGVLNTSFNLHGEPIVCTPDDALSTFARSGLRFLAIGNWLLSKGPAGSAHETAADTQTALARE